MGPVFAIFLLSNIAGGNIDESVKVAGFASLFYWITKSVLQIPIGHYLDKNHGEKDDFWFMTAGTFMMALVPIGYLFSTQPWHIFLLQIFYGVAAAINLPSWSAIFTRHIDSGREAVEWSTHSTFLGIGAGVAAGVGGIAVAMFGFKSVFIFVSAFTLLSAVLLLFIKKEISPRNKDVLRIPVERTISEM
jgi:MFS family permease